MQWTRHHSGLSTAIKYAYEQLAFQSHIRLQAELLSLLRTGGEAVPKTTVRYADLVADCESVLLEFVAQLEQSGFRLSPSTWRHLEHPHRPAHALLDVQVQPGAITVRCACLERRP